MTDASRQWEGDEKIVIAIDCGTTYSGVAYSYVIPKTVPKVSRVLQWPGQSAQKNEAKIPSLIWYKDGVAMSIGAHAVTDSALEEAEDFGWHLARHFKLHLHPTTMKSKYDIVVEPLPPGIALEQIYKDFFGYLYNHTQKHFKDHEIGGEAIWNRLEGAGLITIVITHPNGWGAYEQAFLRKAVVSTGRVPQAEAQKRVKMLSEAEASAHFVMRSGATGDRLQPGVSFIVCDAGGSTVDTTLYTVIDTTPALRLEEKRASACVQAGAIYVDQSALEYFEELFKSADISKDDAWLYTRSAAKYFDKTTFEGPEQSDMRVRVGDAKLKMESPPIKMGNLKLSSKQVEQFFIPWVGQILESVESQIQGHTVANILLVGGFGDSKYLRDRFRNHAEFKGIEITLANDSTAKAVADGAVVWYISRGFVTARAARFSYGLKSTATYDPSNTQHQGRKITNDLEGQRVEGVWSRIITVDTVMTVDKEWKRGYYVLYDTPSPSLGQFRQTLYALKSENEPYYMADENDKIANEFAVAGVIQADLSELAGALTKYETAGKTHWNFRCQVGVSFGGTELSARLIWKDTKGVEQYSPAVIIPERFT